MIFIITFDEFINHLRDTEFWYCELDFDLAKLARPNREYVSSVLNGNVVTAIETYEWLINILRNEYNEKGTLNECKYFNRCWEKHADVSVYPRYQNDKIVTRIMNERKEHPNDGDKCIFEFMDGTYIWGKNCVKYL